MPVYLGDINAEKTLMSNYKIRKIFVGDSLVFDGRKKSVVDLDFSAYFPEGLKSAEEYADEIFPNKAIQKIETKILKGTETWIFNKAGTGGVNSYFRMQVGAVGYVISDKSIGTIYPRASVTSSTTVVGHRVFTSTGYNQSMIAIRPENVTDYADMTATQAVNAFKAHLAELYNNGTPVVISYAISTPIVTEISPQKFWFYDAWAGGTEQISASGSTTSMIADVRYKNGNYSVNIGEEPQTTGSGHIITTGIAAIDRIYGHTEVVNQKLVNFTAKKLISRST